MVVPKVKIELYYDVISPYAWIAFESLLRYQNVWPINVVLKPFSLGGIMKGSNNRPPGLVKNKSMYMLRDLQRNNEFWGMQLTPSPNFMKWLKTETSDNAMKLLLVIQKERPEMLETVSRQLWKRIWTEGKPIFHRADFEKVLTASGITNGGYYIDKLENTSAQLQQNTQDALDSGAFGAPWIVVHKDGEEHTFFGSDRLHLIAHLLGQKFTDGLVAYSKL
ncbi:hypothetical protein Q1695_013284 [Nippostrongylus brasiliensis]|nr:hypothetical protein Q1695_013284 [Nippostrongylus brasiliensis]